MQFRHVFMIAIISQFSAPLMDTPITIARSNAYS